LRELINIWGKDAFTYFRNRGVPKVVCEQKHMGSRAVVVVCRSGDVALKRFNVKDGSLGVCYARTGRHFFESLDLEAEFVERIRVALSKAEFWDKFNTDWFCLVCELMTWSAKAQVLLLDQYAPVGVVGSIALQEAARLFNQAGKFGVDVGELAERFENRAELLLKYIDAYRQYCWPVKSLGDLKLAPFHHRVHECVFGVLALESEPVDPRL
jgi:protein phosphatase